jgi:hypothetical protein
MTTDSLWVNPPLGQGRGGNNKLARIKRSVISSQLIGSKGEGLLLCFPTLPWLCSVLRNSSLAGFFCFLGQPLALFGCWAFYGGSLLGGSTGDDPGGMNNLWAWSTWNPIEASWNGCPLPPLAPLLHLAPPVSDRPRDDAEDVTVYPGQHRFHLTILWHCHSLTNNITTHSQQQPRRYCHHLHWNRVTQDVHHSHHQSRSTQQTHLTTQEHHHRHRFPCPVSKPWIHIQRKAIPLTIITFLCM